MRVNNIFGATLDISERNPDADIGLRINGSVISWQRTSGEQSLVLRSARQSNFMPLDGMTYPVGFFSCEMEVIYRGFATSISIEPINAKTYFYIFAFSGVQTTEKYTKLAASLVLLH